MFRMLFVSFVLVFFAASAMASPFIKGNEFDSNLVEECVVIFNNDEPFSFAPVAAPTAGKSMCVFDVAEAPEGGNVIVMKYVNIWGESESVPFEFTKTLPPTPTDLHLSR